MSSRVAKAARRWYWQRMTAMAMALFVMIHIVVMVYAMNGGLSAAEVLGRTQGSVIWALFYGVFVVLVSVHASIGVRNTFVEWLRFSPGAAALSGNAIGLLLLVLGLRAVWAVTFGSPA